MKKQNGFDLNQMNISVENATIELKNGMSADELGKLLSVAATIDPESVNLEERLEIDALWSENRDSRRSLATRHQL